MGLTMKENKESYTLRLTRLELAILESILDEANNNDFQQECIDTTDTQEVYYFDNPTKAYLADQEAFTELSYTIKQTVKGALLTWDSRHD